MNYYILAFEISSKTFYFIKSTYFFETIKKLPITFISYLIILYTSTLVVMSKSQVFQLKVTYHSILEICAVLGINSVKVLCVCFNWCYVFRCARLNLNSIQFSNVNFDIYRWIYIPIYCPKKVLQNLEEIFLDCIYLMKTVKNLQDSIYDPTQLDLILHTSNTKASFLCSSAPSYTWESDI